MHVHNKCAFVLFTGHTKNAYMYVFLATLLYASYFLIYTCTTIFVKVVKCFHHSLSLLILLELGRF